MNIYLSKIFRISICMILISLISTNLYSNENKQSRIMIATVTFGNSVKGKINIEKIEAALYFACNLTDKFELIPPKSVDSLIQAYKTNGEKLTQQVFVDKLKADKIYFIHTDLLANMLRLEISSINISNNFKSIGVGYSSVHYFVQDNDSPVYDPSILEALQRAMAVAEKDSSMFAVQDSQFFIKPAPTLVISGINFVNNSELAEWDLFSQKEVKSYFILESIYESAINSKDYVIYDIASRDSIYNLFNLAIPENYRSTNDVELSCLENLKVDYFISGEFIRNEQGASIDLYLMEIKNKIAKQIRKVSAVISEDKLTVLNDKVKQLTTELLLIGDKDKNVR